MFDFSSNARDIVSSVRSRAGAAARGLPVKTLSDVWDDIVAARIYIAAGLLVGALIAGLLIALAVPHYRAQIILSPANPVVGEELSSMLANDNLFALRYFMNRVGGGSTGDFTRFENTYDGPSVAKRLLDDPVIVRGLKSDRTSYWSGERSFDPARLAAYIDQRVRMEGVGTSSLRRMVYYHHNADFAQYFLTRIHGVTDTMIRTNIYEETGKRITYLQSHMQENLNPEHRRALTTLLMEQERLRMLVSLDQHYAAAIVEPAAASYKAEWPDAILWLVVFIALGGLSGFIVHRLRHGQA